ncbi:hypothetical protein KCU81_g2238, partial [Aureobasidium melanogenum]|uniref:Uncharacterized protein n=2 Tax=Aureobasidium melanogenum TaxID=46634 RepID=A0A074W0W8_AURM1
MANEPRGAWARPRPGAARTPQQSRSSNASPAPAAPAAKPVPSPAPTGNVWAARAAAQKAAPAKAADAGKKKEQSAPAATPGVQETHVPVNNFNDGEVRQLLSRGGASSVYKLDAPNTSSADSGCMANGKSFKVHLDEQVAAALKKQQEEEK